MIGEVEWCLFRAGVRGVGLVLGGVGRGEKEGG